MKFTIVATVLLGLWLAPALAVLVLPSKDGLQQVVDQQPSTTITRQITINGQLQLVFLNRQWRVATIEQQGGFRSWKTIWDYNTGFIATKVLPERVCYVSVMNRGEMPTFNSLVTQLDYVRTLQFQGQLTRQVTFAVQGPVRDLQAYGPSIYAMCRGLPTYVATEVYGPQNTFNLGSCIRLNILQLVELRYCRANLNGNIIGNGGINGNITSVSRAFLEPSTDA